MKQKVWFRDSAHAQQVLLNLALVLGVIGFLLVMGAAWFVVHHD
jgi:hypothetical protein